MIDFEAHEKSEKNIAQWVQMGEFDRLIQDEAVRMGALINFVRREVEGTPLEKASAYDTLYEAVRMGLREMIGVSMYLDGRGGYES